jgi:vacuolar-type H+-ATPase subunit F/Vma7
MPGKKSYKIKMIGPKYLVSPLALLGIEVYPADSEAQAKKALASLGSANEAALIFISERIAVDLQAEIGALNKNPEINVVLIPDNRGGVGLASGKINNLIRNSIGAEIIIRK